MQSALTIVGVRFQCPFMHYFVVATGTACLSSCDNSDATAHPSGAMIAPSSQGVFDGFRADLDNQFNTLDGRLDRMDVVSGAQAGTTQNTPGPPGHNSLGMGLAGEAAKLRWPPAIRGPRICAEI